MNTARLLNCAAGSRVATTADMREALEIAL